MYKVRGTSGGNELVVFLAYIQIQILYLHSNCSLFVYAIISQMHKTKSRVLFHIHMFCITKDSLDI